MYKKKLKSYDVGVFDSYTNETFEKYVILAKNKDDAKKKAMRKFGMKEFKENRKLSVVVFGVIKKGFGGVF